MPKSSPKKAEKGDRSDEGCCGSDCCGGSSCCGLPAPGCCRVEAVVRVDERGQMVLPKEVRESAGIKAGEKLAVVSWTQDSKVCCLTLHKVDELAEALRSTYGPILREVVRP